MPMPDAPNTYLYSGAASVPNSDVANQPVTIGAISAPTLMPM